MKKSFLIYIDSLDVLDDLTDEQCGELLKAFRAYHSGNEIELSPIVKVAFSPFKNQFERDGEKYQKICERNKNNGLRGGRPVKEKTQITQSVKSKPKKADSDNDSDSDTKTKKGKTKRFAPPSLGELKNYIKEKNLNVGAETFINHYETNGWKVGKNKMVSWKHAAANWSKRSNEQNKDERESSEKKWNDSATGIRGKGKEIGLREGDFDHFQAFKSAVFTEVRRLENAR